MGYFLRLDFGLDFADPGLGPGGLAAIRTDFLVEPSPLPFFDFGVLGVLFGVFLLLLFSDSVVAKPILAISLVMSVGDKKAD